MKRFVLCSWIHLPQCTGISSVAGYIFPQCKGHLHKWEFERSLPIPLTGFSARGWGGGQNNRRKRTLSLGSILLQLLRKPFLQAVLRTNSFANLWYPPFFVTVPLQNLYYSSVLYNSSQPLPFASILQKLLCNPTLCDIIVVCSLHPLAICLVFCKSSSANLCYSPVFL
jgi:hypothetical protein